jgi:hypothetical protein
MISGHATIQTAVEATQLGAYDILEKPLDTDRVLLLLRNALTHADLSEENARLRQTIESRYEIVGSSFVIRALLERIDKVASTPARVLITGENGTGKELVARAIHRGSPLARKPFVEVNCAAIPSELIESELFGHMKGSFTGAVADRAGKFEQADGGTLFLDEIGDMALSAQAKVLRVLQDGVVTRIGGNKPVQVDVRVIAATNKDLEQEIAEGRFREDLFYRLNVVPITVPPLRERREDIEPLVVHFLQQFAQRDGLPRRGISTTHWRDSPSSSGPATCASCATPWSAWSSWRPGRTSRPATSSDWWGVARPSRRGWGRCRLPHVRGVQGRGRAQLPAGEAAGLRLERVGDGARARHAALEPVQEDRAVRAHARILAHVTASR